MKKSIVAISLLLMTGISAQATEAPTLSLGKALFESTELGTKGRGCVTCHEQGKGLEMIGDFNDAELKDIINACLRDAMGGQLMSTESQELEALLGYVRGFQKN